MQKQNKLLDSFEVEEPKKRYEMGCAPDSASAGTSSDRHGNVKIEAEAKWNF